MYNTPGIGPAAGAVSRICEESEDIVEKYSVVFGDIEQVRRFVAMAEKYECNMELGEGSVTINAKSLMAIIAAGMKKKMTLTVYGDVDEAFRAHVRQLQ